MTLEENLRTVLDRIAQAAHSHSRSPEDIALLAVSKGQSADAIRAAYALGLRDFGENYVQEWQSKKAELADLPDLRWHLIGHLQSNKAKLLTSDCYCIQAIDRISIAEVLERVRVLHKSTTDTVPIRILVQLEIDPQDANKFGARAGKEAEDLCRFVARLHELDWCGFMGMGPADKTAEELAPLYESFVAQARALWTAHHPRASSESPIISLGMSGDLEAAVAAGSTMVRIGTALFGQRAARTSS